MGINGIGNSAASWAQFVKLSQAARDRNSGLAPEGAGPTRNATAPQTTAAVSFKRAVDVYSGKQSMPAVQNIPASSILNEMTRKPVGGQFDAYA